ASNEDVVASCTGLSNFWIEARDSPSFSRSREAAELMRAEPFLSRRRNLLASQCVALRQFTASSDITYWLPNAAIVPLSAALIFSRSQTRSELVLASMVISSSVMPSAKKSCSWSPERLPRGSTATDWTVTVLARTKDRFNQPRDHATISSARKMRTAVPRTILRSGAAEKRPAARCNGEIGIVPPSMRSGLSVPASGPTYAAKLGVCCFFHFRRWRQLRRTGILCPSPSAQNAAGRNR